MTQGSSPKVASIKQLQHTRKESRGPGAAPVEGLSSQLCFARDGNDDESLREVSPDFQQIAYQRLERVGTDDDQVAVLCLAAGESITLEGNGLVCVSFGSCSVLGATLRAGESEVYYPIVSAPLGPFYITLTAERNDDLTQSQGGKKVYTSKWKGKEVEKVVSSVVNRASVYDCILILRPSKHGYWISSAEEAYSKNVHTCELTEHAVFAHSIQRFLPYVSISTTLSSSLKLVNGLCLPPSIPLKHSKFSFWPEWTQVCSSLTESIRLTNSGTCPRMMITGARGVGKSMFARTVANFCLAKLSSAVVFIETDVGQAELNPPGLISAHVVTCPLLGSSIGRNRSVPFSAFFFGATSPSFDPRAYCMGVRRVIRDAQAFASSRGFPIITNTHGWISGTGLVLLQEVANLLDPAIVFNLVFQGVEAELRLFTGGQRIDVTSIYSSRVTSITSSQMRELNMTSYFAPALTPETGLRKNSNPSLFRIYLKNLQVRVIGEALPNECLLLALNGTIVGLSIAEEDWRCLGLGLVRAISPENGELFVASPIGKSIQKITGITLTTGLEVPQAIIRGVAPARSVPYVLKDSITNTGAIKARGSLLRKGK